MCYVVFLGFCRAGGLAVHGWLTAAASLGWSVEMLRPNPRTHVHMNDRNGAAREGTKRRSKTRNARRGEDTKLSSCSALE